MDIINFTVSSSLIDEFPIENSGTLFINVLSVNDAPVLHFQNDAIYSRTLLTGDMLYALTEDLTTQYTSEDTPLLLGNIAVTDVDLPTDAFIRVNLTCIFGFITIDPTNPMLNHSLSADPGSSGVLFEVGNGTMDVMSIFKGPIRVINTILKLIMFTPASNYNGIAARLIVTVDDMGNFGVNSTVRYDSKTYRIIVQPVNDVPSIRLPASTTRGNKIFILDEGTIMHIHGAAYQPLQGLLLSGGGGGDGGDQNSNSSSSSSSSTVVRMNHTNLFQSGFEPWRFTEVHGLSSRATSQLLRNYQPLFLETSVGPGRLEWDNRVLGDINPGPPSSNPKFFMNYKDMVFFQANDGKHGYELWVDYGLMQTGSLASDGSHIGDSSATLFMDIMPGSKSGSPSYLQVHGDYLYFAADGVDTSWMVLPAHRDSCGSFRQSSFDSRIHFAVSDSTVWLPQRSYDCPAGYHWASTAEGYRYFTNSIDGTVQRFWHSDSGAEIGLAHGSQQYTKVYEWEKSTNVEAPVGSHGHEYKVYAQECGWSGLQWGGKTRVHFRFSDSHRTGAYKHAGKPDSYRPDIDDSIMKRKGLEGFLIDDFAGIVCIMGSVVEPEDPLDDASSQGHEGVGKELWRTDGTVEGTMRIDDVYHGTQSSSPQFLTSFGNYLYFAATTSDEGRELWRTPGDVVAGATIVALTGTSFQGIYPGPSSSDPADLIVASVSKSSSAQYLLFAATGPYNGRELWYRYFIGGALNEGFGDPGELSVIDIIPGMRSSNPSGFTSSGGYLPVLFQAYNEVTGMELWITDGTIAGTMIVKDIFPGSIGSNPKYITWFRGKFYFQATDNVFGVEVWVSDGTSTGTSIVKDIRQGIPDSFPSYFTVMRSLLDASDYLYFSATDGLYNRPIHGPEGLGGSQIWRTDGTFEGTVRAFDHSDNDLYIDRLSLDEAFPAQFGMYKSGLYIPGNYGPHDRYLPSGGLLWDSDPSAYEVDQAFVVDDVDSHPTDSNITLTMQVDKGYVVLTDKTEVGLNSPATYEFLLAESRTTDRVLLSNALLAMGHSVETVLDGESAYEAIVAREAASKLYPTSTSSHKAVRPFDCVLIATVFDGSVNGWDGLNTIRVIRQWEAAQIIITEPQSSSSSSSATHHRHIPIIAMTKLRALVNDQLETMTAGADLMLIQPSTDYDTASDESTSSSTSSISAGLLEKKMERDRYNHFSQAIVSFLYKASTDILITSTDTLSSIPLEILSGFTKTTVGSSITIVGTVSQVNKALGGVYYYATNYTNGNVSFSVTVTDEPSACILSQLPPANPTRFVQPATYPLLPLHRFNQSNSNAPSSALNISLCNQVGARTFTTHIPLFVVSVNQPPSVIVSEYNFTAPLNQYINVPTVSISDPDHLDVSLNTSFGFTMLAPVTVTVFALGGRISMPVNDEGLVYTSGSYDAIAMRCYTMVIYR